MKPGYKTTEFWLSLLATIGGFIEFHIAPLRNGIITGTVTVFRDISHIYTSRFS